MLTFWVNVRSAGRHPQIAQSVSSVESVVPSIAVFRLVSKTPKYLLLVLSQVENRGY